MTVKQISLITMKSGEKVNLPDALNEAEICFTTDTGEIFIGAPNFGPVQYRSDTSANTKGQGISPYRNIKLLTEFDVTKTITGDFYTQEALDRTVVPLSDSSYKIYTFEAGVNSIIASYSLYDGQNVNLVGELFISVFDGEAMICSAGQQVNGIRFSSSLNSSGEIELFSVNTTNSIYTMYISAKCWKSNVAEWDGTKGNGIKPFCLNMIDEDDSLPSISICTDVNLTDLSDKQFLQYNILDKKWENKTISYSDISGDIPEGKSRISELLDVKLTNLSDGQFLKYNTTDNLWENTSISYSDIEGTPPESTTELSKLTDVKLTNLTDTQILQYSGTDQKWENVNLPPTPASWTISTVAASGSTISDATKCTTSLINVSSSDGYSKGVAGLYLDKQLSNSNGMNGYEIVDISYDQLSAQCPAIYPQLDASCYPYYPVTKTGSGSGLSVSFYAHVFIPASYLESVEIKLSAVSTKPIVGDIINGNFVFTNTSNFSVKSVPFCQFVVTNVGSTTFTMTNNFKSTPVGSTTTDNILNLSKGDIVYIDGISRPVDTLSYDKSPFIEWESPWIDNLFFNPFLYSPMGTDAYNPVFKATSYNESDNKYSFELVNNIVSCRQYVILYQSSFLPPVINIETPGENYNVNDIVTFFKTYDFKIYSITSEPTRGIVLPDSQSTGSMVIVKNNTDNKPINVYSTLLTSSNSLVSTIPDSSYKNYETKFIRTDKGWTKF